MRWHIAHWLRRIADKLSPIPPLRFTGEEPDLEEFKQWNELIYGTGGRFEQ